MFDGLPQKVVCELLFIVINNFNFLVPVVQTSDSAVHWINHYPVDSAIGFRNTYPLDSDLFGG